jgi:F-box-like
MNKLPVEFVEPILQNLSKRDLRSVRLVSRAFAAIASPYLFETIILLPFKEIL